MGVSIFPEVALPPGMVMPYAGGVAPSGWLLCDGQSLLRTDYPDLFTAIGTTYGLGTDTTTNTTFALPNLKGRVIVGFNAAETEFDTVGEIGGAKTVALVEANIPGHTHTLAHTHGMNSVDTNHAHNVYARNQETGTVSSWHTHNYDHWHLASFANVKYLAGEQPHDHAGGAGWAAEAPNRQTGTGAAVSVNVVGTGAGGTGNPSANHTHNFNHDHPSTNYQSESPWAGTWNHAHTTNTQSATTTSTGSGAGSAHQNLQPYMTMHYLIKT